MLTLPLFIGGWELIIIAFIVLLLFGGKKLPELMKGLGKGVKNFKEGMSEIDEQINLSDTKKKDEPKKVEENNSKTE